MLESKIPLRHESDPFHGEDNDFVEKFKERPVTELRMMLKFFKAKPKLQMTIIRQILLARKR
jgi:hypothetical protein